MTTLEKNISPFITQQFPAFYRADGKNFVAFVRAYYEWLESTGKALNRSRSLLEYSDIDKTEAEFIEYFKKTYMSAIPKDIATDNRLLLKHILELYRTKGSKRSIELLFRILFNEDIEVFIPGDYLLRPSDGEWYKSHYIEITSHPNLYLLSGKTITNSDRTSRAVVETYSRKVITGKTVNILYLSSVQGQFEYGEKIICDGVIQIDSAPIIIGSLTAIPVDNGGSGFSVGEILSITGSGSEGKARVAAVRNENGKVQFNLINGGSGYSLDATVTVATTINILISDTTGSFTVGSNAYSTATSANGNVVFANSSYLTLINFSAGLSFNTGDTISDGTATATIVDTFGGGGSGATFDIGGLVDKEILRINTDKISSYVSTKIETQVRIYINSPTGAFTVGNQVRSSANAGTLQVTYTTPNTALLYEKLSNSTLGIANLYVYFTDSKIVKVTGSESDLTNANLVPGIVLIGNTSLCELNLDTYLGKETVIGNGSIFTANSSAIVANTLGDHMYFVPTATVVDIGNPTSNANITSQESLTDWIFPSTSPANLDRKIEEVLDIYDLEVGTIAYLKNINPGSGYSSPPYVDIIETDVALMEIADDTGGVKGHNAVVDAKVSSEQGVVTAVEVYDSGFGYVPGEKVIITSDNAGVTISGVAVVSSDGRGLGYWKNSRGFLSDIINIQDSDYYQIYSYEVVVKRMLDTYEGLVKDLIHPAGHKLFGRYRSSELLFDDVSLLSNSSSSQSNTIIYTVVDTNFVANTATFTRASNASFLNIVSQYDTAGVNIPRYNYTGIATYGGLLFESARTNSFGNPRGEGTFPGILGSGGSGPTNWGLSGSSGTPSGLAMEVIGTGVADGLQFVRLRLFGTSTGVTTRLTSSYQVSCSLAQQVTSSVFHRLVSGSQAGFNLQVEVREYTGTSTGSITMAAIALEAGWSRAFATRTITGVSTNNARYTMRFEGVVGVTYDFTYDLAWPQLELGGMPSSPILPPIGTLAASTRDADLLTVPLTNYGINIDSDCTVLVSGLMPTTYPTSTAAPLINLRRDEFNSAGALGLVGSGRMNLAARNSVSGATSTELSSTDFRGQVVRAGFVVSSATATVRGCVNGGSVITIPWRPDPTLITARIGSSWTSFSGADSMALFGQIKTVQILPYAITDSALLAAVAALPI